MLYLVSLVALLIALAGVIAYLGDRLGTLVGRRRLSLFGWRPRRTGQLVGIAAGIVIMLSTLAVLMLAFRGATGVLVNAQHTYQELAQLRLEQRGLQSQVGQLGEQIDARSKELAQAQATVASAKEQRDAALAARDAAEKKRDELQQQTEGLQQKIDQVTTQYQAVQANLQQAQDNLASVQQELTQATKERDEAEQQVDQAKSELAAKNDELAGLEQQLKDTQAKLQAAQKSRDAALTARDQALKDAQQAQQQAVQLRDATTQLEQQLEGLNTQVSNLKISAERLRQVNQTLTQSNATLQDQNAKLQQGNALLSTQNNKLQLQLGNLSKNVTTLQNQIDTLNGKLAEQAQALTNAQRQVQALNSGDIIYQKGQIIYQGTISAQDPGAIQTALSKFVQDANSETLRKGAGQIALTPEQVKSLIDALSASPGADVVALISPINQFSRAQQVQVEVEAYENDKLLDAGQLVVSKQIYLGTRTVPITQADMRGALAGLIADATSQLQRLGLFAGESPELVDISEESFTALLSRMTGAVVIGLVAAEPVYRSGPAKLELTIIR